MPNDVGSRIKRLLAERGLTQRELSLAAGLPATAVKDILRKGASPTLRTLMQLAAALEIDVACLVSDIADVTADKAGLSQMVGSLNDQQRAAIAAVVELFPASDLSAEEADHIRTLRHLAPEQRGLVFAMADQLAGGKGKT